MTHSFTRCLALLVAALFACPAQAQTPPLPTPRQALDAHFANLDKTQVPTGFLAEYGVPLAPLHLFTGALTDSSLTSPEVWRLAYATAYTARVGAAPNPLPTIQTFNARVETSEAATPGAIPLLLARLDYASVRPDAFALNLLTLQNQQVLDVAGRSQSPYQRGVLFAAAPAQASAPTGAVSFVFDPTLHVQYGGPALARLELDFGTGSGYAVATWGQPLGTVYPTAGLKRVKVRVTYSDGGGTQAGTGTAGRPAPSGDVVYESWFNFEVQQPAPVTASRTTDFSVPFGSPTNQARGRHGLRALRHGPYPAGQAAHRTGRLRQESRGA